MREAPVVSERGFGVFFFVSFINCIEPSGYGHKCMSGRKSARNHRVTGRLGIPAM